MDGDLSSTDISENDIRENMPEILDILLMDRTKSNDRQTHNIIWANDSYIRLGRTQYAETSPITPELITGPMKNVIKPRALKSLDVQHVRTKNKGEVFTPTWIVKKQNDAVDEGYQNDDLVTYINRTWLEITAGEAPYMASRYDMDTGKLIPINQRVGFIDRKLHRINEAIDDQAAWFDLVVAAYQSSYGFEWNGDSLLIARENVLYTFLDYFKAKWHHDPEYQSVKQIAEIISYNLFQMDGLNGKIPLSEQNKKIVETQMSLFDDDEVQERWIKTPGKKVKIMNWQTHKMEFFQ
jgi:hypothetical protein